MQIDQIVLVVKQTDFEQLILRHASVTQAAFVLERRGDNLEKYAAAHRTYQAAIARIRMEFPKQIPVDVIDQSRITLYPWRPGQLIVVCGPDGLFVNLAKLISNQSVIAVNPDPVHVSGKIMIHAPEQVGKLIDGVMKDTATIAKVTLGKVTTNDGQELLAVNDFLVGRQDQRAARYHVAFDTFSEDQCSSGILISAPMGGTGQIQSVMDIVRRLSGNANLNFPNFSSWEDTQLAFVVREPYASVDTGTIILNGYVRGRDSLVVRSQMAEGGVIFSDGMTDQCIDFCAGVEATFGIAPQKITFVTSCE